MYSRAGKVGWLGLQGVVGDKLDAYASSNSSRASRWRHLSGVLPNLCNFTVLSLVGPASLAFGRGMSVLPVTWATRTTSSTVPVQGTGCTAHRSSAVWSCSGSLWVVGWSQFGRTFMCGMQDGQDGRRRLPLERGSGMPGHTCA